MRLVSKWVNFNGKEKLTLAEVIEDLGNRLIVEFTHDGVVFRGCWLVDNLVDDIK